MHHPWYGVCTIVKRVTHLWLQDYALDCCPFCMLCIIQFNKHIIHTYACIVRCNLSSLRSELNTCFKKE